MIFTKEFVSVNEDVRDTNRNSWNYQTLFKTDL